MSHLSKDKSGTPSGPLQPLNIPEWKWESIAMDFVVGLPRTLAGHDSIWVIIDKLTKSAHFLPVKTTYSVANLCQSVYCRNSLTTWGTDEYNIR